MCSRHTYSTQEALASTDSIDCGPTIFLIHHNTYSSKTATQLIFQIGVADAQCISLRDMQFILHYMTISIIIELLCILNQTACFCSVSVCTCLYESMLFNKMYEKMPRSFGAWKIAFWLSRVYGFVTCTISVALNRLGARLTENFGKRVQNFASNIRFHYLPHHSSTSSPHSATSITDVHIN